ncbi:MAG: hypothetical protein LC132_00575 [Burkholderiales bacterium]|jgi:hypothetical protein|uniref:hypothetical protein n=1 Tax=Methanospirillum sp. TaxID=45200 RepID=UPI0009CE3B95|nr:hypothetical protein [Methanospirillum sp.]MCZ2416039.1 hypothetical protein [Burkholderiales bacterium]OQB35560.1 MAG: hypothetical protein BWY05_01309 [Euryarchaeota archaeon ADurb.Bin165]HQB99664.1 hypothetical protein [Methanospirillum sp.]
MNIDAVDEVLYIVTFCIGDDFNLVSVKNIENHVLQDPGIFPFLAKKEQKNRRNIISRIMNARYELWNDTKRTKIRNRVWNLRKKRGSE